MRSLDSKRRIFVKKLTKSKKYLEDENFLMPIKNNSIFKEEQQEIKVFKEKSEFNEKEHDRLINEGRREPDNEILTPKEHDRLINEGRREPDNEILTPNEYARLIKKLEIASIQPNQRTNKRQYVFKK